MMIACKYQQLMVFHGFEVVHIQSMVHYIWARINDISCCLNLFEDVECQRQSEVARPLPESFLAAMVSG